LILPFYVFFALLISIGSGILGALLGLGGGVILVPLLIFLLDVPIKFASGASIVAVVATSSAAAATYVRDELTNIRLGMFLELATTLGAVSGAFIISLISENLLKIIFGVTLLYAALTMYMQQRRGRQTLHRSNDRIAEALSLDGRYFDEALGEEVEYGVVRTPITFGVSYLAGVISGLLGIGGGGIKVPTMNVLGGVPMKVAVATSNFMIGVTASASALFYISNQYCDTFVTAPVILGTLIGASIGARLTNRLSSEVLKKFFVVVLCILAARMILSGVGF
jgi:uncharacterized membrane protein YfcA